LLIAEKMMTQANPAIPGSQVAAQPSPADAARTAFPAQVEKALAYAAENKYAYGPGLGKAELVWEVAGAEKRAKEVVRVSLRFRPAKSTGKWGEEYVDVAADGSVATRRVIRVPREAAPWVLIFLAAISVVAAGALIPFILFYEGGDPLYVAGRTLYMRATEPKLLPFVLFSGPDNTGVAHNWAIKTEGTGTELAVIKVTLINAQSNAVRVIVDEAAAELRTGDDQSHKPLDLVKRTYQTETTDPRSSIVGFVPLWTTVTLDAGKQVEGYMVFEVPAGSTFKEFRWNATDSAIVRFGG
jgi:hypothetical protein